MLYNPRSWQRDYPGGRAVLGRLVAGIAGSIPLRAFMCLLCLYDVLSCVSKGLCDGLITRPEESYHVFSCVWLRNLNIEENKAQRGL
jgi:hypothetical protein